LKLLYKGETKMAVIKYIRVSTQEQNTARQEQDLEGFDKVFIEKASGKNTNRPQLQAMLDYVREGDTVKVESYSRIARNTHDLLAIVEKLENKGVHFISQKEQICECQRKSEPSANQYLSHLCERILEPPTPKVTANT